MESGGELPPYKPIACSLHDQIEASATRRRIVDIVFRTPAGAHDRLQDRIVTWFTREGAEFLTTESGRTIRLDRIVSIDGVEFRDCGA